MAAMVAAERHLWLTLSDMKNKDRVCLLDAPLSSSGLFGDAVNSVVDRFQEVSKQAAAFRRFLPRRSRAQGAAGQQPSTSTRLLIQGGSKGERCLSRSPAAEPEAALLVWDFKVEAGSEVRAYG